MRYERVGDIVRLAVRLQGSRGGLTMADIQEQFSVSRRTAERMRDAVEAAFGPLDTVELDSGDRRIHWRLRTRALHPFIRISPEELAGVEAAAGNLGRTGLADRLRDLVVKLRAASRRHSPKEFDAAMDSLMEAEGLAMRAGPRENLEKGLFSLVREAISTRHMIEFDYLSRTTSRRSRQQVRPYGLLHGNRAFLVGPSSHGKNPRLWRLANVSHARITAEAFERDPTFHLRRYVERSFGTFQEKALDVRLRFAVEVAPDARNFQFHPNQTTVENGDGSLTVRFRAGGIQEMCWHLVTWGANVTVLEPPILRRRLAEMCAWLATHHRLG
jgi:predicted DNA-binding transcriptional regulator YafY